MYQLKTLEARLPEIAWFIQTHQLMLNPKSLPKGLFRISNTLSGPCDAMFFLNEIRQELSSLMNDANAGISTPYVRARLAEKVQVLVKYLTLQHHHRQKQQTRGIRRNQGKATLMMPAIEHFLKAQEQKHGCYDARLSELKNQCHSLDERKHQLTLRLQRSQCSKVKAELSEAILEISKNLADLRKNITLYEESIGSR